MRTLLRLILKLILSFATLALAETGGVYTPLSPWNGELMQNDQGAVYVRFYLDKFTRTRSAKDVTTSVFMNIRNLTTKQNFVVNQSPNNGPTDPLLIWKIPEGSYVIEKLTVNENTGITRVWTSKVLPQFTIKHLYLSNLGEIRLSPYQATGMRISFLSKPNVFNNPAGEQTFVAVIDGYKGLQQQKLGGDKLAQQSISNFGNKDEARAAFSFSRQISMLYQVNSNGTQQSRKLMSQTIAAQDSELRRCYMDQIEQASGLKGSVNFKFAIAPQNGSFQSLEYNGGTLKNSKVLECLSLSLKKIQFPVAKTLVGKLVFQFSYDDHAAGDHPGRAKFP